MELIGKDYKVKKVVNTNERNYWFDLTVKNLPWPKARIGWWTKGWDAKSLRSLYLASESLAKETGEPFAKFWKWQYNKIKEQLNANKIRDKGDR